MTGSAEKRETVASGSGVHSAGNDFPFKSREGSPRGRDGWGTREDAEGFFRAMEKDHPEDPPLTSFNHRKRTMQLKMMAGIPSPVLPSFLMADPAENAWNFHGSPMGIPSENLREEGPFRCMGGKTTGGIVRNRTPAAFQRDFPDFPGGLPGHSLPGKREKKRLGVCLRCMKYWRRGVHGLMHRRICRGGSLRPITERPCPFR